MTWKEVNVPESPGKEKQCSKKAYCTRVLGIIHRLAVPEDKERACEFQQAIDHIAIQIFSKLKEKPKLLSFYFLSCQALKGA
jgi:hypothetical protein